MDVKEGGGGVHCCQPMSSVSASKLSLQRQVRVRARPIFHSQTVTPSESGSGSAGPPNPAGAHSPCLLSAAVTGGPPLSAAQASLAVRSETMVSPVPVCSALNGLNRAAGASADLRRAPVLRSFGAGITPASGTAMLVVADFGSGLEASPLSGEILLPGSEPGRLSRAPGSDPGAAEIGGASSGLMRGAAPHNPTQRPTQSRNRGTGDTSIVRTGSALHERPTHGLSLHGGGHPRQPLLLLPSEPLSTLHLHRHLPRSALTDTRASQWKPPLRVTPRTSARRSDGLL